jgi:hypothetical protein
MVCIGYLPITFYPKPIWNQGNYTADSMIFPIVVSAVASGLAALICLDAGIVGFGLKLFNEVGNFRTHRQCGDTNETGCTIAAFLLLINAAPNMGLHPADL